MTKIKVAVHAAPPTAILIPLKLLGGSLKAVEYIASYIIKFSRDHPGLLVLGSGVYIIGSYSTIFQIIKWTFEAIDTVMGGNLKYIIGALAVLSNISNISKLLKRGWGLKNKLRQRNKDKIEIDGEPREVIEKAVKAFNSKLLRKKDSIAKMHTIGQPYLSSSDFNKSIYINTLTSMGKTKAVQWLKSISSYSDTQISNTMNTIVSSYV